MAFRHRPMEPKDVRECVEIVSSHPVVGSRYGSIIGGLQSVWRKLLGREAFRAVVFEEAQDSRARRIGVGVSVFVSDEFLRELKTPPFFWIGPELTKRVLRGDSPLLSDKQVRLANRSGGLTLVPWEWALHAEYLHSGEAVTTMIAAFVDEHRGFLLKELISNTMSLDGLEGAVRSGGLFLSPDDCHHVESLNKPLHEIFASPYLIGLTRELAMARAGTWIGSLFVHRPPQFSFRPSEQRLLLAALRGGTDDDLADTLGISLSGVKKTWRLIYERVHDHTPGLIPEQVPHDSTSERGREKKQRLLAYLRDHLEELRPAKL